MLKFVKDYMATIDGIEIYPIISLSIFFLFFVGLFWWVFTAKSTYINEVNQLPLETNENHTS